MSSGRENKIKFTLCLKEEEESNLQCQLGVFQYGIHYPNVSLSSSLRNIKINKKCFFMQIC